MSILTLGFIRSRFNIMKDRNLKVRSKKAPICLFFLRRVAICINYIMMSISLTECISTDNFIILNHLGAS